MPSERFREDLKNLVPDLFRFAQSMSRNKEIAEELAAETVIVAMRNWEQFRPGSNMAAWLYTIQAGIYQNMLRKNRKRTFYETDADATMVGFPAPQQSTVDLDDAFRVIETLPDEQRQAIYLVCRDGHSYEDAARILACEIGTVKSRIYRARAAIAKAFEGEPEKVAMKA